MEKDYSKYKLIPIEKVYYAFYQTKKKQMYFNEIRDKTGMSISSLQNALLKLERLNGVIKIKEKGNVFYQLDYKHYIILNFIKFDLIKFSNLNRNIKIPLQEFLDKINNVAFVILFGSASIGQEKKSSDIDLLIVTNFYEETELNEKYQKEIKNKLESIKKSVNAKSLHPLNLVFVNEKEFKDRKDYLLLEAKKTGFCVYNQQQYYKEVLNNEN
ncbi:MAG: nucleotidyltransferase domain-containing protein [Nanoarchaeota archaeon]|nr:nucleotidyltransferase domain-containing protein [Nanoarchaeota archaeon]